MSIDRYALIKNEESIIAEAQYQGCSGLNTSEDETLCIVYCPHENALSLSEHAVLPSYVKEEIEDIEFLTHEQARTIIDYQATSTGASDGWYIAED